MYIPVENELELRLGIFCVNVELFPTPRGVLFFKLDFFLFNYLFDWLQPGKHCLCWAGALLDWDVDSTGSWERITYQWRTPGLSGLPHTGTSKAQMWAGESVWTEATRRSRGIRSESEHVDGGTVIFCLFPPPPPTPNTLWEPNSWGGRGVEGNICLFLTLELQSAKTVAVWVTSAEWKGKPSQSFQQLMVLVISTVVYSLLLLRRDAARSSPATIHNCSLLSSGIKYGKKGATQCPPASPPQVRWAEMSFFILKHGESPSKTLPGGYTFPHSAEEKTFTALRLLRM